MIDDVKKKKEKLTAENAEDAEQDKEYGQDDRMNRIKHTAPGSSLLSSPSRHPVNSSPVFSVVKPPRPPGTQNSRSKIYVIRENLWATAGLFPADPLLISAGSIIWVVLGHSEGYNPDMERFSRRIWHTILGLAVLVGGAGALGGCQKALYPDGSTRTQYERYQTLRGEYRPPRKTTALGEERPALRQRLAPLDQR